MSLTSLWTRWTTPFVTAALVAAASPAYAQDQVDKLAAQLQSSKDFRVRTQAALALGASKSKRAVDPLCKGLGDENSTVRAAAAAGLGKLKKGGLECLKAQAKVETKDSVKVVLAKSIQKLEAPPPAPAITAATKFYLAIDVVDESGRPKGEVAKLVRAGAQAKVKDLPEFVLAPAGETPEQAQALLAKHSGVTGFMLSTKVLKPSYAGGALTIKLDVAIFSYPDRNLKGNFLRSLSMQGVSSQDRAAEDELIRTGASRTLEMFAGKAASIH